jgi:4-phosphopantoate--beta-alanine ligase
MHRSIIPSSHPRAKSLYIRELLVNGFKNGIVVEEGLIAHGRGETFDYLLGEDTTETARTAIKAASC